MRQNSYSVTLTLSASEQKLLNQIWRANQNTLPTIESAVYKLALDGIRAQLAAQKEENRVKYNARKSGEASAAEAQPETAAKPQAKSKASAEA